MNVTLSTKFQGHWTVWNTMRKMRTCWGQIAWTLNPCCNIQLETSFFKPKRPLLVPKSRLCPGRPGVAIYKDFFCLSHYKYAPLRNKVMTKERSIHEVWQKYLHHMNMHNSDTVLDKSRRSGAFVLCVIRNTLVWPILCISESYKDQEARISPTLHSQSRAFSFFVYHTSNWLPINKLALLCKMPIWCI